MVATRRFSSNFSDPIADLLTRIRNANTAYKDDLLVPASKMNESVLKILVAEGYVAGYAPEGEGVDRAFRVQLKYGKSRAAHDQRDQAGLEARPPDLHRAGTSCPACWAGWASRSCPRRRA